MYYSSRRKRNIWARVELLEDRRLLAFDPTGMEQEMLENINRVRANPADELDVLFLSTTPGDPNYFRSADTNVNLALDYFDVDVATLVSQWSSLSPVQPLAWSSHLSSAALTHNNLMIAHDQQSHQLPGEPGLQQRVEDAGYVWSGTLSLAENVFAYSESVFHAHAAFLIDWGLTATGMQNPPGHRNNIMDGGKREIGVSVVAENNPGTQVGPYLVTQDFGYRGNYGDPKVLGVVYADLDADGYYDAGEGQAGITVTLSSGATNYQTTTMTAGGYQIAVSPGTYTVTATGAGLTGTVQMGTVVVASQNEKLDLETTSLPSGGSLTGRVYNDIDENGAWNGPDEGLAGWTVFLDANNDGDFDTGELSTATAADGHYEFSDLGAGTYHVRFVDQTGFRDSPQGVDTYSVSVSLGTTTANLDFARFQDFALNGQVVDVYGTLGDDAVAWEFNVIHTVTLNGQIHTFSGWYTTMNFHSRSGDDALELFAGSGNDVATLREGEVTLTSDAYTVTGEGFTDIDVDGGGGDLDQATLYDSTGNEDIIAKPWEARLIGASFNNFVKDFDRINSYANSGGNDRAYVYDGETDDRFIGHTNFSVFRGNNYEFYTYMEGFERNFAFSSAGGTDQAFFYDSINNDNFFGYSEYAVMQDAAVNYFNYAHGFDRVFAYAYDQGVDHAYLYDSTGNDSFSGRETFSIMQGENLAYYHQVHSFERVFAYANNGGTDTAYLFDSAGNDVLVGYATSSVLRGANYEFHYQVSNFETVIAYGNNGGSDTADLYDGAGDDLFFGRDNYGYLSGSGFFKRADNFESVTVRGTAGGQNTLNVASLDYALATVGEWL